ncbi:Transport of quorum-sensing signal protein [Hafnia alvei]|uniref:Transport of quorum-sensing signal protein n=1 Tax=Hafnia alvei TaxID=569 RepID=A0A377PJA9_HAFAL|nr:Transport of quorum-sensing signal protein [Hafnia alvei]
MSRTVLSAQGIRIAIMAAALVIVLAGVRAASDIIVPFLLALFLAIILNPLVTGLMRLRLPRAAAVGLVLVIIILLLTLMIGMLGSSLNDFSRTLPQYRGMLANKLAVVQHIAERLNLNFSPIELANHFDPGVVMNMATRIVTQLSGAMSSLFLLLMTVVFMLMEVPHLPYKLRKSLSNADAGMGSIQRALDGVTQYFGVENRYQRYYWRGGLANVAPDGDSLCHDVGCIGFCVELYPEYWFSDCRCSTGDSGTVVQ